jgi:hypothetical protein
MKKDKNEFLPRYEKVQKLKIPKSSPGCLIVPPNDEGKRRDKRNLFKGLDFVMTVSTRSLLEIRLNRRILSKRFIMHLKFAPRSGD